MELSQQINLAGCLLLHQKKRDSALGLAHVTTAQKGLLWYYNALQKELYTKSFYYGVILGCRRRIKQIKKQITVDTPLEQAQGLYKEALILQEQIAKAEKIING